MSTLSELLPSGGGGSTVDFVASGTLPNGKAVILKSDGTVEVIGETPTSVAESIPAGSEATFNSGQCASTVAAFDPNTSGKFVIAYRDNANGDYGTAVIGTVSGTTITFGAEYLFASRIVWSVAISFDPSTAGKFVVIFKDGSNASFGTAIVGTISGATLSFGSMYIFNSANSNNILVAFDPNTAGKFVIAYSDAGNADRGTAVIGTVSGTAISFGAEYVFNSGLTFDLSVSFDPNTSGKFVIAYRDFSNAQFGTAIVGTVSGTAISFGAEYVFNSGLTFEPSVSFDPNTSGKFVVAYRDNGNSGYGTAVIGTVSGTAISFGAEYVFDINYPDHISVAFDPNTAGKFVVVHRDGTNMYGKLLVGTVSGTIISFGSAIVYNTSQSDFNSVSFDPSAPGKFVVAYSDANLTGAAILGQSAATIQVTNLTTTNFLGTSTEAYTNAETATIAIQGGLSTNQTGLTIGSTYYVQPAGTLATTAGTPPVVAGKALSTTTLLLKDL
jgi:hypothetical protein